MNDDIIDATLAKGIHANPVAGTRDLAAQTQQALEAVGWTATEVTGFTDGWLGLRAILANVDVTKLPILDWFHIAMRLQHTELAAANLPTDDPERVLSKAVIVAEVERLQWRIWDGKAKNAQCSIKRIRKVMHVFKAKHSRSAKAAASSKLWHALHAVDNSLRGQVAPGWPTMPNASVPVNGSARGSPKAQQISWSTGA